MNFADDRSFDSASKDRYTPDFLFLRVYITTTQAIIRTNKDGNIIAIASVVFFVLGFEDGEYVDVGGAIVIGIDEGVGVLFLGTK